MLTETDSTISGTLVYKFGMQHYALLLPTLERIRVKDVPTAWSLGDSIKITGAHAGEMPINFVTTLFRTTLSRPQHYLSCHSANIEPFADTIWMAFSALWENKLPPWSMINVKGTITHMEEFQYTSVRILFK